MCQMVEIQKGAVPANISIEFERDASLRVVAVVVINRDRDGVEYGIKLLCHDNGRISGGTRLRDGVDIVAFAGG